MIILPLEQTREGGDGLHPTDMLRNQRFLAHQKFQ